MRASAIMFMLVLITFFILQAAYRGFAVASPTLIGIFSFGFGLWASSKSTPFWVPPPAANNRYEQLLGLNIPFSLSLSGLTLYVLNLFTPVDYLEYVPIFFAAYSLTVVTVLRYLLKSRL